MVGRLAGFGLSGRRRRQRAAACPGCSRAAASKKCALEKTAPLSVKVIEELLVMEFEIRATPVISSAHGRTSLFDVPEVPFLDFIGTDVRAFRSLWQGVASPIESPLLGLRLSIGNCVEQSDAATNAVVGQAWH
jgi:hypothetical protein